MLTRFWFKGCAKCGGDMCLERDGYGPYISCLHCGAVVYSAPKPAPALAIVASNFFQETRQQLSA